jgi:hypothetical protein
MVRIEALISIKHILAMHNHRFPPPWSVEELDVRFFIVKDDCVTPITETIAVGE